MVTRDMARRELMRYGSAALAGLALLRFPGLAQAFPSRPGEEVLPWADQPAPNPVPQVVGSLPRWEQLDSYLTPAGQFFTVAHYGQPAVDAQAWRLEVGGLVDRPLSLTLADLRARPRQEVVFTLECSGNHGLPFLTSAVGTARWGGTPLAPLLAEAGVQAGGSEVVFWGADAGEETVRDVAMTQHFARSMSAGGRHRPHRPAVRRDERGPPAAGPRGAPAPDRPRLVRRGQRQVADPDRGAGHPPDEPLHGPRLRDHPGGAPRRGGRARRCGRRPRWAGPG